MVSHHVYLVPGFFGFANLGELVYFEHVRDALAEALPERGVSASLVPVPTLPTSSIRQRALRILETMAQTAGDDDGPIHIIGHSSGGLDARLALSPQADLGDARQWEHLLRRVRSVVTVSTPHRGTPLASFFASLLGQHFLRLLSLSTVYTLRYGGMPISMLLRLRRVLSRLDAPLGRAESAIDHLFEQLLSDFGPERRQAISRFFGDVGLDQSLLVQLAPDAMDLFNASTGNRPGVAYGSVITRARPPSLRARLAAGLDVYAQVTHTIYGILWDRARRLPARSVPRPDGRALEKLQAGYGSVPGLADNDGIVPSLSQVFEEVIHVARADHLDVIGHYDDRDREPRHVDWLCTGTGFDRVQFEEVWDSVARFMVASV